MATHQHHPSRFSGQFNTAMPKPVIPVRRTPLFLKALWALALLVLVGTIYSFWRISRVAAPTIDVPAGDQPALPQTPNNPQLPTTPTLPPRTLPVTP